MMNTVTIQRRNNGVVELIAHGDLNQEQAFNLFRQGLDELYNPACTLLTMDLRNTQLLEHFSLFKLYKLINLFHDLPLDEKNNKKIDVLYNGSRKNLAFLEKTILREGLHLQFSQQVPMEAY